MIKNWIKKIFVVNETPTLNFQIVKENGIYYILQECVSAGFLLTKPKIRIRYLPFDNNTNFKMSFKTVDDYISILKWQWCRNLAGDIRNIPTNKTLMRVYINDKCIECSIDTIYSNIKEIREIEVW